MSNNYYNRFELKKIKDNMLKNPYESRIKFYYYIKKYPRDYISYGYYAECLLLIGEYDEAERIIDKAKELCLTDKNFEKTTKNTWFEHIYKVVKLKIMIRQGNYKRVLNYYNKNKERFDGKNLSYVRIFLKKKLGIDEEIRGKDNYLFQQILDYDYDRFVNHILKHTSDNISNTEEVSTSIFNPDFPLLDVIKEVNKNISRTNVLHSQFIDDIYIFKYDNCGRVCYKPEDYFKVICFERTNNIITMYPCKDCEKLPYVDLNYLRKNKEELPKIKKLTAIERFNKKYNIM